MKFMDKVKNLFTEEVEEEVPVRKEKVTRSEVEIPKREETIIPVKSIEPEHVEIKNEISDTPILSREERPKMPIYFDDDAFADLKKEEPKVEEKKPEIKRPISEYVKKDINEFYKGNVNEEEVKTFKPSPVISPVYGVLDRNYRKDDIPEKKDKKDDIKRIEKPSKITVDDIRNKAFGTLEDDLETNMFTSFDLDKEIEKDMDMQDEVKVESRLERNNANTDLLREDFKVEEYPTREEKNADTVFEEQDLTKELEKQKQKINEINEFIKNNTAKKTSEVKEEKPSEITEDDFMEAALNYEIPKKNEKFNSVENEETTYTSNEVKEEIPSYEEEIKPEPIEEKEIIAEEPIENNSLDSVVETETNDDGVESELFDLIDSMYEKRNEE